MRSKALFVASFWHDHDVLQRCTSLYTSSPPTKFLFLVRRHLICDQMDGSVASLWILGNWQKLKIGTPTNDRRRAVWTAWGEKSLVVWALLTMQMFLKHIFVLQLTHQLYDTTYRSSCSVSFALCSFTFVHVCKVYTCYLKRLRG